MLPDLVWAMGNLRDPALGPLAS